MDKYGSLSAVLEADPKDMVSISGIGENSSVLLSRIPSIAKRYFKDRALL